MIFVPCSLCPGEGSLLDCSGSLLDCSQSQPADEVALQACKDDRDRNAGEQGRRHDVVPLDRISAADQGENLEGQREVLI